MRIYTRDTEHGVRYQYDLTARRHNCVELLRGGAIRIYTNGRFAGYVGYKSATVVLRNKALIWPAPWGGWRFHRLLAAAIGDRDYPWGPDAIAIRLCEREDWRFRDAPRPYHHDAA